MQDFQKKLKNLEDFWNMLRAKLIVLELIVKKLWDWDLDVGEDYYWVDIWHPPPCCARRNWEELSSEESSKKKKKGETRVCVTSEPCVVSDYAKCCEG